MLIKCPKQGIKNRVGKSAIFVLNKVRVWGATPRLPTQGYIEYPPGGSCAVLVRKRVYTSLILVCIRVMFFQGTVECMNVFIVSISNE